jgi:O-antigen ligase
VFQTLIALLLYAALYVRRSLWLKGAALAYGAVAMVVLLRAYSKAGVLSLGLWAVSWTTLQKKFVALALVAVVVTLGGLYYSHDIATNVTKLFHKEIGALEGTVDTKRTFAGRWYGWQEMMVRWQKFDWPQKVFGSGELAVGAHNDYLLLLFHGGVVGLAIYLALLTAIGTRIVLNLWRRIDPLAVGALMLFLMWLVDTIGLVPSSYPGYQWFVWGMIGLSFRLREEEATSATEPVGTDAITGRTRSQERAAPAGGNAGYRYPIIAPRKTLSGI